MRSIKKLMTLKTWLNDALGLFLIGQGLLCLQLKARYAASDNNDPKLFCFYCHFSLSPSWERVGRQLNLRWHAEDVGNLAQDHGLKKFGKRAGTDRAYLLKRRPEEVDWEVYRVVRSGPIGILSTSCRFWNAVVAVAMKNEDWGCSVHLSLRGCRSCCWGCRRSRRSLEAVERCRQKGPSPDVRSHWHTHKKSLYFSELPFFGVSSCHAPRGSGLGDLPRSNFWTEMRQRPQRFCLPLSLPHKHSLLNFLDEVQHFFFFFLTLSSSLVSWCETEKLNSREKLGGVWPQKIVKESHSLVVVAEEADDEDNGDGDRANLVAALTRADRIRDSCIEIVVFTVNYTISMDSCQSVRCCCCCDAVREGPGWAGAVDERG